MEKERDEIGDREERPAFVQEAGERGEARELSVGPAEQLHQLVDGAVGAEDLREKRAREEKNEGEIDAREPWQPPERDQRPDARGESDDAAHAQPVLGEMRLQHEGGRHELEP